MSRPKRPRRDSSGADLDAREAARALKAALAESDARSNDETDSEPEPRPRRRRRPPTSHGAPMQRPERRRRPSPEPKPPPVDPRLHRPSAFVRHDLAVVLGAVVLVTFGSVAHRWLTAVAVEPLEVMGLSMQRPSALLPPVPIDDGGAQRDARAPDGTSLPYHVEYQSPTRPLLRLEVQIEARPTYNNLHAARALDRASRYGEMLWTEPVESVKIGRRNWQKTAFRYAFKANSFDSPAVATGVEFATLNGGLVYVVTAHGEPAEATELADLIEPTLSADPNHPAASVQ